MKMNAIKTALLTIVMMVVGAVAWAQGYTIRSGDTLSIEVLEDPSLNRSVLVLPDGSISFPFAGSVKASGRTPAELAAAITSGIASNFASQPNVFVTVQSLRAKSASAGPATISVYMLGQISTPGEKKLKRGTTLIQALATTGGFSKFAATKRIILRRTDPTTGKQTVSRINYNAIADGAVGNDIRLMNGDVIIVPERRLFE